MKITIEVPDNATNKDVVMALFPDAVNVGVVVLDKMENILFTNINYTWWKLPYEGGKQ